MQYFDCPWSNFAIAEWQLGTRLKWWMEILVLYILDLELLLDISFTNSTVCLPLGYWLLHISLQGCNHEVFFGEPTGLFTGADILELELADIM